MHTRRTFLLTLAAAAARPPLWAGQTITFTFDAPVEDDPYALGVQLGAEEAARTATLLGLDLQVRRASDDVRAAARLRANPPDHPGDAVPLVTMLGPSIGRCAFVTRHSTDERLAALRHAVGGQPGRPIVVIDDAWIARARMARAEGFRGVVASPLEPDIDTSLVDNIMWIADWHPSFRRYGASELNERFERRFARPMNGPAWHGWVAVKALTEAMIRRDGEDLCDSLAKLRFDGHKGRALTFDPETRTLRHPLLLVARRGGEETVEDVL